MPVDTLYSPWSQSAVLPVYAEVRPGYYLPGMARVYPVWPGWACMAWMGPVWPGWALVEPGMALVEPGMAPGRAWDGPW